MITVQERFGSRRSSGGSIDFLYLAIADNEEDETEVKAAIQAAAPDEHEGIESSSLTEFEAQGNGLYFATITFAAGGDLIFEPTQRQRVEWSTSGGTQHITQSKSTIWAFAEGVTIADPGTVTGGIGMPFFKGAIGVDETGDVQGVDIVAPVFNFTVTKRFRREDVDDDFLRTIFELTGTVNSGDISIQFDEAAEGVGSSAAPLYADFEGGELLFLGAHGGRASFTEIEISFDFSASKNINAEASSDENIVVGDIEVDHKDGWDYLWVYYKRALSQQSGDSDFFGPKPSAAFVERVYLRGDHTLLGLD